MHEREEEEREGKDPVPRKGLRTTKKKTGAREKGA